jgi:hypothetical protein
MGLLVSPILLTIPTKSHSSPDVITTLRFGRDDKGRGVTLGWNC